MTSTDAIETLTAPGFRVDIVVDPDPPSPREEESLATFWCWHRRYNLGDVADRPKDVLLTEESIREVLAERGEKVLALAPLFLYDHSGITMQTKPYGDRWDSGQVGWAFVTQASVDAMGGTVAPTEDRPDPVRDLLEGEVSDYATYLEGNVYGVRLSKVDADGNEEEESAVWGYMGMEEARVAAKQELENAVSPPAPRLRVQP